MIHWKVLLPSMDNLKEKWPDGSLTELKKRKCKALHQESWLDRKWELIFWKASLQEKSWKGRGKELIKGSGFLQNWIFPPSWTSLP